MRRSVLVLALTLAAAGATAQEHPWMARFQAGSSTIHEWGRSGVWGEARFGRSFVGGVLSADLGLAVSSADEGYGTLTAGLEVLPFPRAVVAHVSDDADDLPARAFRPAQARVGVDGILPRPVRPGRRFVLGAGSACRRLQGGDD